MNIAMNTALQGMMAAHSQLAHQGRHLVDAAAKGEDVIQPAIAIKQAEQLHAASATVARTAGDMQQRLLDITA